MQEALQTLIKYTHHTKDVSAYLPPNVWASMLLVSVARLLTGTCEALALCVDLCEQSRCLVWLPCCEKERCGIVWLYREKGRWFVRLCRKLEKVLLCVSLCVSKSARSCFHTCFRGSMLH
jgi:hypothetical protein